MDCWGFQLHEYRVAVGVVTAVAGTPMLLYPAIIAAATTTTTTTAEAKQGTRWSNLLWPQCSSYVNPTRIRELDLSVEGAAEDREADGGGAGGCGGLALKGWLILAASSGPALGDCQL